MIAPFLIGIALALVFLVVARFSGLDREKGVYPALLISIALFYVVFALEHGNTAQIIFNVFIAGLFIAAALLGYLKSLWIIAAGLILHGLFDAVYPAIASSPAPTWWAPFCLAVDVLFGLFLISMIIRNKIG